MRWEDERYVRVYTRDTTDWLAFSFEAQALLLMLLRKVDRAGILPLGKHGKRGVAIAIGHPREWERLESAFEELLADGCVRVSPDGTRLVIPNFIFAQEARASDKSRQQKSREFARDLAASESVTLSDGVSQNVTECHGTSHGVTPSHTPSPLAVLSRAVPSQETTLAPAPADAVSEAVKAFQSDDFALEAQDSGPKPKKPSAGERLYLAFEASRQEHCAANGLPFVEQRWDAVKINTVLGKVAKVPKGALVNAEGRTEEQVRLEAAWKEYLSDPDGATREPAWSIGWFMSGGVRSRYEFRALRAAS